MKKVASLVIAALVLSNLSACTNRNMSLRDSTRNINPGITKGTRTEYGLPNQGTTQGIIKGLKDGVYKAQGNPVPNGNNQTAIITVSGGKITNIDLRTINSQGRDITDRGAYPGTSTGTGTSNTVTGSYGTRAGIGLGTLGRTSSYTGVAKGNTGITTGYSYYDRARRELITNMMVNQNFNISLSQYNGDTVVQNWKLAVQRAIDMARTGNTTRTNMGGTPRVTSSERSNGTGTGGSASGSNLGGTR